MRKFNAELFVGRTTGRSDNYPKGCPVVLEIRMQEKENDTTPRLDQDLSPCPNVRKLSMCGAVWQINRCDIYSGGQNIEEIAKMFRDNKAVSRLAAIWREWHLNDTKAGTREQEAAIAAHEANYPDWSYSYTEACKLLEAKGLLTVNGYRYGTAWLVRQLPEEVWQEVETLAAKFQRFER